MLQQPIPKFVSVGIPKENAEALIHLVGQRLQQRKNSNANNPKETRVETLSDRNKLIICAPYTYDGLSRAEFKDSIGVFVLTENKEITPLADQMADLLDSQTWFVSISSNQIYKSSFVKIISQKIAAEHHLDEADQKLLWTVIEEAVSNGVIHGNLELKSPPIEDIDDIVTFYSNVDERLKIPRFGDRRIILQTWINGKDLWISVSDEGLGYDIFKEKQSKGSNAGEAVVSKDKRYSGRGMQIIRSLTKEIRIDRQGRRLNMRF